MKNKEKNYKSNWRQKTGYHNISTVAPEADLITERQEAKNGRLKYSKCCKIAKSGILYTKVYFGIGKNKDMHIYTKYKIIQQL